MRPRERHATLRAAQTTPAFGLTTRVDSSKQGLPG